jgi:hypothetical protein
MRPKKAKIVVITVQDLKVCFSDMPKYWPTSQNPLSFTCENILAPDAMAITMQASSMELNSDPDSSGATSPAAVIMATVEDP